MVRARPFRRQQQENQIDRLIIERFEVDRFGQSRKQPEQPFQTGNAGMRYGYPMTNAGRAESFPFLQRIEDRFGTACQEPAGAAREIAKQLRLVGCSQRYDHAVAVDEVGDIHG